MHLICCRNWHWDEPSCGKEMCVVLYHQPSETPEGRFLFQWNDENCSSKNNFVCKYAEGELVCLTHTSDLAGLGVLENVKIWYSWLFF